MAQGLNVRQSIMWPSASALVASRETPLLVAQMLDVSTMRNVRTTKFAIRSEENVNHFVRGSPVFKEPHVLLKTTRKFVAATHHFREMVMFIVHKVSMQDSTF